MEDKNFTNDDTPQNMKKRWIDITDEYNRQLGTNFSVAQVKNKKKNHEFQMKKKSKMFGNDSLQQQ